VVSLDLDSRVWTLSLDGEVSCVVVYTSIRGLRFLSVGGRRFGRLIPLLRVPLLLGVFYTASCLLILLCMLGASFSLPAVNFVLLRRRICDIFFWSVFLCGICGMQCPVLLDIIFNWMGQLWIFRGRRCRSHLVLSFGLFGGLSLFSFSG